MPQNVERPTPRTRGCEIVLFHSVLGLRPGVLVWADRLRAAGHTVHTPDLYDGETFDDYEAGFRKVEALGGIPALMERTYAAVAGLPDDLVYAGFSNGAASAELLALTRPGARGAVLLHGAIPPDQFDGASWPGDVPAQLHFAERDPFNEPEANEAFVEAVRRSGAELETWDYPADGHLFADPDLPEYDEPSAELMFRRVLDFLDRIGGG